MEKDEIERDKLVRVLSKVGPSLFLASISEFACFFIGALSNIPAIRIFALNAGFALLINFFLQMSAFICFLYLDNLRQNSKSFDIFCCFGLSKYYSSESDELVTSPGIIQNFFKEKLSPTLMKNSIRTTILFIFLGWLFVSISVIHKIDIGLDQKLSMPKDSYVLKYLETQTELRVGPPVHFVVGGDYKYDEKNHQNMICGTSQCSPNSLINLISQSANNSNQTYIAKPANSWLDDYLNWFETPKCCCVFKNSSFCPSTLDQVNCKRCKKNDENDFKNYLNFFLSDIPTLKCSKG